ncbi:MAG: hypothetical protein JXA21_08730 [Anaerolineae bacterium]|nr:hypothetical protein [Anaerolineae bacterium]
MDKKNIFGRLVALTTLAACLCAPPAGRASPYALVYAERPRANVRVSGQDFRISNMGPARDTRYFALRPSVAYNYRDNEYLVVWAGDTQEHTVDNELEIYGRRVDAQTGIPLGGQFRISAMGPDGNPAFGATDPAVAYNPRTHEYLVVWRGDDVVDNELEIYAQRLDAAGVEIGPNDVRISSMGPEGDPAFGALAPAVVNNPFNNEYLVVWYGDDVYNNVVEIYGQRLNAAGAEIGPDDFVISDMGDQPDAAAFRAQNADVTYNPNRNEYLVVWEGNDSIAPLAAQEVEIFGQRLNALGNEVGANDFRISAMGPDGDPTYAASHASVTYNPAGQEYLVVWSGNDDATLNSGETEIYGQRLTAAGLLTGFESFRITSMGPEGDPAFKTFDPAVRYNLSLDEYLVVWRGDDNRDFGNGALVDEAYEIFGQWLDSAGNEVGDDDFRISDAGTYDNDPAFDADRPAVAFSPENGKVLAVWQGDDDTGSQVEGEVEISGRWFSDNGPAFLITPTLAYAQTPYARQVYTFDIGNHDKQKDAITFTTIVTDTGSLAPCGTPGLCEWQVLLSQPAITLGAGEHATLTVTVLIPANETLWVTHTLTLLATSQNDGKSRRSTSVTGTGGRWNATLNRWVGCRFDVETASSPGFILSPDILLLYKAIGSNTPGLDYNQDGQVSVLDMLLARSHLGKNCNP